MALLALLFGLQACAPASTGSNSQSAARPSKPTVTAEALAEARRFREAFGLRHDDAWLVDVATNPASEPATVDIGVPLLPSEFQDVVSRVDRAEKVLPFVMAYGEAYSEDWAGAFIDQQAGGAVTALFTDRVDLHRDRLDVLLPEGSAVVVRGAGWSLGKLNELAERVRKDAPWFRAMGTELYAVDLIEQENRLRIRFVGPEPAAADDIEAHYGDESWFFTKWMGSGGWQGARGGLDIIVESPDGAPLRDMRCVLDPIVPAAREGDIASVSGADGRCILRRLPAVDYRIEIEAPTGDDNVVVGETSAHVVDGALTLVRVAVVLPD